MVLETRLYILEEVPEIATILSSAWTAESTTGRLMSGTFSLSQKSVLTRMVHFLVQMTIIRATNFTLSVIQFMVLNVAKAQIEDEHHQSLAKLGGLMKATSHGYGFDADMSSSFQNIMEWRAQTTTPW